MSIHHCINTLGVFTNYNLTRQKCLELTRRSVAGSTNDPYRPACQVWCTVLIFHQQNRLFPQKQCVMPVKADGKSITLQPGGAESSEKTHLAWSISKGRSIYGLISPSWKWQPQREGPGTEESCQQPTAAPLQINCKHVTINLHKSEKNNLKYAKSLWPALPNTYTHTNLKKFK